MRRLGLLPGREDDEPAGNVVLGARHVERDPAAVEPGLAELGLDAAEHEPAAVLVDPDRLGVVEDLDPLLDRPPELVLAGRDLVGPAPVDDLHVLAAREAPRRAAGVHRDVAGADDDHLRRQLGPLAAVDAAQELDSVLDPPVAAVLQVEPLGPPRTDRQEDGVVALLQLLEGDVVPERRSQVHRDPWTARQHPVDVLAEDLGGQRNAGMPQVM